MGDAPSSPVNAPETSLASWLLARPLLLAQAFAIVAASFVIYWPALNGGLIWDDVWYITENPLLHNAAGLGKLWTTPGSWVEYYPLNQTVLWISYQLWGEQPLGYHLLSLALHVISALLVWRLLSQFGLRLAWLGGLLFAIHPVQVPSVAWICELKNTASLPPALLAMSAWIEFEKHERPRDYWLAFLFYVISMLGKITLAPFPAVMLLYAWWLRGRNDSRDIKRMMPFFLIACVLITATMYAATIYNAHIHAQDVIIPVGDHLTCWLRAGVLWWFYLGTILFPVDMSPLYPRWDISAGSPAAWLPLLAVIALIVWCFRRWVQDAAAWSRHALLGLGFFTLTLGPFLGLVGISYMTISWVEIHLLYLPVIGIIGLAVALVEDVAHRLPASLCRIPFAAVAVVSIAFLCLARSFAGWFTGEETFWTRTLRHDPGAWIGYADLGIYEIKESRYAEAITDLKRAIAIEPNYAFSYYHLGAALERSGQTDQAKAFYREAIRRHPGNPTAYLYLGETLRREGRTDEAVQVFRDGLAKVPDAFDISADLAGILLERGQVSEALQLFDHAASLDPDSAQLQYNYGTALMKSGNLSGAEERFSNAVALDPHLAPAHQSLGAVLAQEGKLPDAIDEFEAALAIDPTLGPARDNLARALAQSGRIPDAIAQFQKELEYHPDDAQAQQNLAKLQQYEAQHPPGGGSP
jgi:tetratricopeptide (TPR) repeat protein